MADKLTNTKTSLPSEEVIVRAVQFFATEKFRCSGQSNRTATFDGRPPIPWFLLLLTVLGFVFCVVPGIIMYILVIRKVRRFYNLVVTATPIPGGTEVTITHPDWAARQVRRFIQSLPGLPAPECVPFTSREMILDSMRADDRSNWNALLRQQVEQSEKSWTTALVLSVFLGLFGADRLYLGQPLLGTLKLCTCGLGGLWWLLDVGLLLLGVMKDAQGKSVKRRS